MANNKNKRLLTAADIFADSDFPLFKNDKERIKYMRLNYGNMSLSKAFGIYYGLELDPEVKKNSSINNVVQIAVGDTLCAAVKEFSNTQIIFDIPGVKEEIICKENFTNCYDHVSNYLLTHNNKLYFEVREKKNNTYIVSVINAYYKMWVNDINKAIKNENGIHVHIDSLVQGGYLAHTSIINLNLLTGRNYTHSVFIPGSHIVLNIEHDFEKWVGEDVIIVPQNFVEFRKNYKTGETENSLVGSRKRVLQILGMNNMINLYNIFKLSKKDGVKYVSEYYDGVVTGIINSQNKTGIFVELTDQHITGLAPVDSYELIDYKPGDSVRVRIKEFEVQEGKDPIIYNKRGKAIKCNIRPVFEL